MGKEFWLARVDIGIKDNGWMVRDKDKELKLANMEPFIKENGKMGKEMGKEF